MAALELTTHVHGQMQDEMKSPPNEAAAGFPDHPHRGFETCSIMLSGKMEHRDSFGNHVRPYAPIQDAAQAGKEGLGLT